MNTAQTKTLAGTVVMDFVRSLGYDPRECTELIVDATDLTIRGIRIADGRVAVKDGHPIEWSESYRIDWGQS